MAISERALFSLFVGYCVVIVFSGWLALPFDLYISKSDETLYLLTKFTIPLPTHNCAYPLWSRVNILVPSALPTELCLPTLGHARNTGFGSLVQILISLIPYQKTIYRR